MAVSRPRCIVHFSADSRTGTWAASGACSRTPQRPGRAAPRGHPGRRAAQRRHRVADLLRRHVLDRPVGARLCRRNPVQPAGSTPSGHRYVVDHGRRRQRRQQRLLPRLARPGQPERARGQPGQPVDVDRPLRLDPGVQHLPHRPAAFAVGSSSSTASRRRPSVHGTNGVSSSSVTGPHGVPPLLGAVPAPPPTSPLCAAPPRPGTTRPPPSATYPHRTAPAPVHRATSWSTTAAESASHSGSHTRSTAGQRIIPPSTSTGSPSRSPTVRRRGPRRPVEQHRHHRRVRRRPAARSTRSTRNSDSPTSVRTTSPRSRSAAAISSRCRSTTAASRASPRQHGRCPARPGPGRPAGA